MVDIKDKVAAWYVQNFVISKSQVFDIPGFVQFKISGSSSAYSRQVIFPESFFINLEKEFSKEKNGGEYLYSLGKKFGRRFSNVGNIKKFDNLESIAFKEYVYLITRFVEGTYASKINHNLDSNKKLISFEMDNFVICSKSGLGYFLTMGGIAGIWSTIIGDDSVEAIQTKCQGRGDNLCEVIAAPISELKNITDVIYSETNLGGLTISKDYFEINKSTSIQNSSKSFQFFLDSNLFSYKKGVIKKGEERFFIIESSIIHLIELSLKNNENLVNLFEKTSYEAGYRLVDSNSNLQYLIDLISALGFGDLFILKKGDSFIANVDFYPWSEFCSNVNHLFFCNFISGMLSKISGKKVKLKNSFTGFNGKGFTVSFS